METRINQMDLQNFKNLRIQKRNLIYIINLPREIIQGKTLRRNEYFGQYGPIFRVFIDKTKPFKNKQTQQTNYGVYITYEQDFSAGLALLAVDGYKYKNATIKASFGLTKYCKSFLIGKMCKWKNCQFLHKPANNKDVVVSKDDLVTQRQEVLNFVWNHSMLNDFLKASIQEQNAKFPSLKQLQTYLKLFIVKDKETKNKNTESPNSFQQQSLNPHKQNFKQKNSNGNQKVISTKAQNSVHVLDQSQNKRLKFSHAEKQHSSQPTKDYSGMEEQIDLQIISQNSLSYFQTFMKQVAPLKDPFKSLFDDQSQRSSNSHQKKI